MYVDISTQRRPNAQHSTKQQSAQLMIATHEGTHTAADYCAAAALDQKLFRDPVLDYDYSGAHCCAAHKKLSVRSTPYPHPTTSQ